MLLAALLWLTASVTAQAENRVALLIGNSNYKSNPLANPRNDAALMAEALREASFDVTVLMDVDYRAMKLAMVKFGRKLRASDSVGLFYYAGHGVQVSGDNFLIPVDAEIQDESEVSVFAINVNEFLRTMRRSSSRINIVVLDACRDNPYSGSARSASRGLARVDAPRGTYIAYATSPGKIALDGRGLNSPYTKALAAAIRKPGLSLEETFKMARRTVLASTDERQTPWETSSITGQFFFKKADPKPQVSAEDLAWSLVRNSTNPDVVATYLKRYPNGKHATKAKASVAKLVREREERRAAEAKEREHLEAQRLAKLEAAEKARKEALAMAAKAEKERQAAVAAAAQARKDRERKRLESAKAEAERQARIQAAKLAEQKARERQRQELEAWQAVSSSKDTAQLQAYLAKYPFGPFSDLANARLAALTKLRVAALQPPDSPSRNEAAGLKPDAPSGLSRRELALKIQQHLERVGCNPGRPDGAWGRNSRAALQRFARHGRIKLASFDPSEEALRSLTGQKARICPVICGKRHILRNNRCVLKTCPRGHELSRSGTCTKRAKKVPKEKAKPSRTKVRKPVAQRKRRASRPSRNCRAINRASACAAAGCRWYRTPTQGTVCLSMKR